MFYFTLRFVRLFIVCFQAKDAIRPLITEFLGAAGTDPEAIPDQLSAFSFFDPEGRVLDEHAMEVSEYAMSIREHVLEVRKHVMEAVSIRLGFGWLCG